MISIFSKPISKRISNFILELFFQRRISSQEVALLSFFSRIKVCLNVSFSKLRIQICRTKKRIRLTKSINPRLRKKFPTRFFFDRF
ncbi:hypothetical protein CH380_01545 [Leptospira adleri]|uniref:Uncharacterized protein n=1 Tax=Leptospira adleri TaxID=2023186 RepID=A0A2M9YUK0_9LEPT|nr:hypothetical protein CH380_01545 [Leptospira adleri]PJZ63400.1 hypothetical protein CH376_02880 [Leptospira adleri]